MSCSAPPPSTQDRNQVLVQRKVGLVPPRIAISTATVRRASPRSPAYLVTANEVNKGLAVRSMYGRPPPCWGTQVDAGAFTAPEWCLVVPCSWALHSAISPWTSSRGRTLPTLAVAAPRAVANRPNLKASAVLMRARVALAVLSLAKPAGSVHLALAGSVKRGGIILVRDNRWIAEGVPRD